MTDRPSLSVVIPAYNAASTIGQTLAAVKRQSLASRVAEIIVVDNASTDATGAIAEQHGVTVLREERRGPSAARNRGLAGAKGDIVCHVDADAVPTRHWLAELVKPFAEADVLLVGGKTISFPPTTPAQRYTARCGRSEPESFIERPIFPFIPSQNIAFRREPAVAAGGWNEDMITAEDVEFCHRLLQRYPAMRMGFAPSALVMHHDRSTDDELRNQAWMYGQGAAWMYRNHPETVQWDRAKTMAVINVLVRRGLTPLWELCKKAVGAGSHDDLEFATYHRLWTWWWWRGFYQLYQSGEFRPRP
ncbi:hypothetical protein DF3PB_1020004 [uncultured Defluviicoccus sp.]|uniref:Glycosyltransferase 2-like domain-containing protein n=1 Tax=metagenome TaxID=256318 RepID=A0A380T9X2_9ZZZZ|nr:hypothetical protein DF3PB_1020004 [uncultured Defluviicoccus sp.]